ncbi:Pyridoxine 4-dehydrogenase [Curvularia kusanoi]|uniref:Pyridoxine 4-dehydrogenase n=1 Tax=Curvularia kusanoi TaxID=90978 RepID=A0A9P4T6J2_CURKU|nr:Pyridoxine 4-dehydrogenase [Curvularia kusanoi]
MTSITITDRHVGQVGYGLMSLTLPWGPMEYEEACKCMKKALECGANLWNGGIHYGTPDANSLHLLRYYFQKYPEDAEKVVISIKGALSRTREPTGSPEAIRASVEEAYDILKGVKSIDVFEMARVDPNVPVETSVKALADLVAEGKIGGIGLSEVSASTIRRANAVHKIAAVEIEMSLFTPDTLRNGILDTCREQVDIPVIAYSPVGRGFLTGKYRTHADIPANDFRHTLARFKPDAFEQNAKIVQAIESLAQRRSLTAAQVAIAWVARQGAIPIPGSSNVERVAANSRAVDLTDEEVRELNNIIGTLPVDRMPATDVPDCGSNATPKNLPNSAQLQVLEKKIESLTEALMAKSNYEEERTELVHPTPAETPIDQADDTDSSTSPQQATHEITLATSGTKDRKFSIERVTPYSALSSHEVQYLLDRYVAFMASNMPFVLLPSGPIKPTAFTQSPFLLQAIIVVAHFHDTSAQQTLVSDLIQQLTTAVFTKAEKSLDLLQALLVLCTWYNPHLFQTSSHTTLLHLCMALTTDLAIDRDPAACEMAHMAAALKSCGIPQPERIVTDEERRAVLGVFWIASTIFTSFKKTDFPTWTPWLQVCLDELKGKGETVLARLVDSQRVMHTALFPSTNWIPDTLQAELGGLADSEAPNDDSTANKLVQLQRTCASVANWNNAAADTCLDGLWTLVHAIKSYLDIYASLPVPAYLTVPFSVFAQFAFVFVVMVRVTSIHIDGFDGTLLREYIDFEKVMGEATERYEKVERLSVDGVVIKNEGFRKWAEKTRWAQVYYGMKAAQDAAEHTVEGELHIDYDGSKKIAGGESLMDGDAPSSAVWDEACDDQGSLLDINELIC